MKKKIDTASTATLVITFILFVVALFTKGFTHDLLLETGVFLVSVKLVLTGYKQNFANQAILERLDHLNSKLEHPQSREQR